MMFSRPPCPACFDGGDLPLDRDDPNADDIVAYRRARRRSAPKQTTSPRTSALLIRLALLLGFVMLCVVVARGIDTMRDLHSEPRSTISSAG